MELSWLESLFYGLLSGFAEFLPISAEAHRGLYLLLVGAGDDPATRLAVHLGALIAVLVSCGAYLQKLMRQRRIAAIPKAKRKRQPDVRSLKDLRLLKTAAVPIFLWFAAYPFVSGLNDRLWFLALLLAVNGLVQYLPQRFPTGNKDSRNFAASDSLLLGLSSGAGVVPGISRMGAGLSLASLRGMDRLVSLELCFLLFLPAAAGLIGFDCYGIVTGGMTGFSLLKFLTAAIASFFGGCGSIFCMRFV